MAYDVTGSGIPLYLLHAFPFDRRFWRGTSKLLQARQPAVQTVAPDLRGFGESTDASLFSIADLADDVATLMNTLGHAKAVICGLSMGGYVALAFANRHADRLSGLILADTKAGADSPEARQARGEAIALVNSAGVAAYFDKTLPKLVAPAATASVRAAVKKIAVQQRPAAVAAGLQALRDRPDRRTELARITCPTLVIVGSEDALTPPAESRDMATAIKGARLVEIPGSGHLSNHEAPAAFVAAVSEFLTTLSRT